MVSVSLFIVLCSFFNRCEVFCFVC